MLEEERDALRERLASFERGETDAAYRAELTQLTERHGKLRSENEELRRRVHEARRRRRRVIVTGIPIEEALRRLWRSITGQ